METNRYADKSNQKKSQSAANSASTKHGSTNTAFYFDDNRPEAVVQGKLLAKAQHVQQPESASQLNEDAQNQPAAPESIIQKKENKTGMPNALKTGMENLSGYSLDNVRVHYNSSLPAQLNAHAFAQGSSIHIAPGQEKTLPHEAWHVVQQKQERVRPTAQRNQVNINDDKGLENEADVMGRKALQLSRVSDNPLQLASSPSIVAQLDDRSANPYEQAGAHEGYALTAHHIVPHSKLALALTLLNNYDKAKKDAHGQLLDEAAADGAYTGPKLATEILKDSIPATLTKDILVNIGVFSNAQKANIEDSWLPIIQHLLKGTKTIADIATDEGKPLVGGVLTLHSAGPAVSLTLDSNIPDINTYGLETLRSTFYEWQGGNQFMGPSTDLREEPGSKDEIDFDAQWITAMGAADFEKLTGLKQAKHQGVSKPATGDLDKTGDNGLGLQLIDTLHGKDKDTVPTRAVARDIKTILEKILTITRDVTPDVFKPGDWKEVKTTSEFENLEQNLPLAAGKTKRWGRQGKGVTEHAFFRVALATITGIPELTTPSISGDSNTAYDYLGTPIPESKLHTGTGGPQVYLPVKNSRTITPAPTKVTKTMAQALRDEGIVKSEDAHNMEIDDTDPKLKFEAAGSGGNRKFSLKGYEGDTVFAGSGTGRLSISLAKLGKNVSTVTPSANTESLYAFCNRTAGIQLSTYMPQKLYTHLNT